MLLDINLLSQPARLPAEVLGGPTLLPLCLALLTRHDIRAVLDGYGKGCNDTLNDVIHVAALRRTGRELDHVTVAEGIAWIGDQETCFLCVEPADVLVPNIVAMRDGNGALHATDRHDGAGLERGGVCAEFGRRLQLRESGLGWFRRRGRGW